jgi:hypothetical protein
MFISKYSKILNLNTIYNPYKQYKIVYINVNITKKSCYLILYIFVRYVFT